MTGASSAGIWMLAALAAGLVATGLPSYVMLVAVSVTAATVGVATGALDLTLLTALPARLIGLLENDLLQALPLYAFFGALLNRLPVADILFRTGTRLFGRSPAAPQLSALALGTLVAPMSGSVGASATLLARVAHPRLAASGVPQGRSLALACVASTLGVVIPPSLVLILLGDAMMRAHTEAVNTTHVAVRIINTQDVFYGSLPPAALFVALLVVAVVATSGRAGTGARSDARPSVTRGEWIVAACSVAVVGGLLAGVAMGYLFAVEAAATGAVALCIAGFAARRLDTATLGHVLRDALAVTGALFALFAAATTFSLLVRAFGTDRLLGAWITELGGTRAMLAVFTVLALCALVLDAFEILFVVIPAVMPPLLVVSPDAVWISVLAMLVLQASFLAPPFGYAFTMARLQSRGTATAGAMARALAPFVAAQLAVLALVVAFPGITHWLAHEAPVAASPAGESGEELSRQLDREAQEPRKSLGPDSN